MNEKTSTISPESRTLNENLGTNAMKKNEKKMNTMPKTRKIKISSSILGKRFNN
jgi:hypothetical protein